jgi:hypothetical protein
MHGSRSKILGKKSRPYIYDVKFLALLGAPYIYIYIYNDISRIMVKDKQVETGRAGEPTQPFPLAPLTLGLQSKKTSYFYGTGYILYPYF